MGKFAVDTSVIVATIEVHPPAARLRLKGQTMRYTVGGETTDYDVTHVSMPDEFGRCQVTARKHS